MATLKTLILCAAMIFAVWATASAQQDPNDPGEADSVIVRPYSFVQETGPWPDSIGIPVYIWADDTLGGYALGFAVEGAGADYFTVSSIVHDGPCFSAFNTPDTADPILNTALFGWADFSGVNPCVNPQAQLATVYLRVDPYAPLGTFASLDSSFVPPAGRFNLAVLHGHDAISVAPQFSSAPETGMPTIALGDTTGVQIVLTLEDILINGEPPEVDKQRKSSTSLQFTESFTINEGDELSFFVKPWYHIRPLVALEASGMPSNATFDPTESGGPFTFTPDSNQGSSSGEPPYEVTFYAEDNDGRSGTINVYITVLDNSPAIACGDVNGDGGVNLADAIALISYIFGVGHSLPLGHMDVNCDGKISMSDVVYLIWYIFANGSPPCDTNNDGTPDC